MGRPPQCHCHCAEPSSSSIGGSSSILLPSSSSSSSSVLETIDVCSECPDGIAACWEITVAGITTGTCLDCANYNGTFILSHNAACSFRSPTFSASPGAVGCGPSATRWIMGHEPFAAGVWELYARAGSAPTGFRYQIAAASFDCIGPNVFTFFNRNVACATPPATITATPINCP